MNRLLPLALVIALPAAALADAVKVTSMGDLDFRFKPGHGQIAAQSYCLTCHSSAYVSTQPILDRAHWAAEVAKMRAVYGAPIPDNQVEPIVDYLTQTYGKT